MSRNKSRGFALNSIHEDVTFPLRQVRQPMSLNLFKCQLLGDKHVPADPQTEAVLSAMSAIGVDSTLDPRTWKGWFGKNARRVRGDSLRALDMVATRLPHVNLQDSLLNVQLSPMFFSKMLEGGLCKELLEPCASKSPEYTLMQRADDYESSSPWHLHVDALEAVALAEGNGKATWETVKVIAASKVLRTLHHRWSPRNGSIYSQLSSNFKIEWETATDSEKERIRQSCARMKPDIFPLLMNREAIPDWSKTNIESDISPYQVHKLLFAMAADQSFLVEDRFDAWALDLATAALASLAGALADRYNSFGGQAGPEFLYWDAFEMLFFREEEGQEAVFDSLYRVMEYSKANFSLESFYLLIAAGKKYKNAMSSLGVSSEYILELTSRCWAMHPMVYQ